MIRRPRFKPHLRVEVLPGEGVFLLSEQRQSVLQGRLYEQVASRLDGRPVEGASIQFVPPDGGRGAFGTTDQDGYYTLSTFKEGDGAPKEITE